MADPAIGQRGTQFPDPCDDPVHRGSPGRRLHRVDAPDVQSHRMHVVNQPTVRDRSNGSPPGSGQIFRVPVALISTSPASDGTPPWRTRQPATETASPVSSTS